MNFWVQTYSQKTNALHPVSLAGVMLMLLVILGSLGHSATSIAGTTVALRESYAGNLSFELTGGSFRTTQNNNSACTFGTSSSNTLTTLPIGATILKAYLYWAASADVDGGGSIIEDTQVKLNGDDIFADIGRSYTEDTGSWQFFNSVADVTSHVSGNGFFEVTDLDMYSTTNHCNSQTMLGGWALLVIYEHVDEDFRVLNLYEGFESFQNRTFTLIPDNFELPTNPSGKHAHITWEGDDTLGTDGEYLEFEGVTLSDANNPTDNQFNSYSNVQGGFTSYGVDIDEYDISNELVAGATQVTTKYSAGQDLVLLSAEIVSVSNIPVADLSVTTSDPTGWLQGSTVTKKYTISNNGPNDIPIDSVHFTASLPAGVSFTGTQGDSDWTCTPNPNSGDTISCVFNTKLRSGWSDYLDLTFKVDDGTAGNILDIDVSVDHDLAPYNIFDNQQTNNSYQFSVPIGSVAVIDLSASSKVHTNLSGDLLLAGDTLRYTITLDDASNLPVTGITVTDKLPDNISAYNVISSPVAAVFSTTGGSDTGTLTFNNITLTDTAPGDTQEIIFEVTIDSSAPRGSSLQNQATISQGASNWLVDTGDITVVEPDLSPSTKTVSDLNGGSLLPQETVRYTITLDDSQDLELSGLQLTDHLPDYISSYTVSGLPAGASDVGTSDGGNNGTGLIDIRNITVPAGGTVSIQIDAVVDANAPDGTPMKNTADLILGSQSWQVTSADLNVQLLISTPASGNKPLYLLNNKLSRNLSNTDYIVTGNDGVTSTWTIESRLQSDLSLNTGDIRLNLAVEGHRTGNSTTTLSPTLYYNDNQGSGDVNIVSGVIPAGSYKINTTSDKTLNMNLATPVTIPAGSSIYLKIDNSSSNGNNSFGVIDIHSINGSFRSEVILNASTVINVDSITIWDAPYGDMNGTGDGKLLTDSEYKGDLYVRAQISDPFGAFDISAATITATKPDGSQFSFPVNSDMSQVDNPSDDYSTNIKTFEKHLDISSESNVEGVWIFTVTGYEGLETAPDQVTHDAATSFLVKAVININLSPSTKLVYDVNGGLLQAGETIHYTFTIDEASDAALNGIQITDNLPANIESFTLDTGSLPAGATDHSIVNGGTNGTGYIDIQDINLAAGEVIEIHLDAVLKSDAPDGASMLNTASFIFTPQDWLIKSNDLLVNTDTTVPASGNKPLYLVGNTLTRQQPTSTGSVNIASGQTEVWAITPVLQSELILNAGDLPLNLAIEGNQTNNSRTNVLTANLYYNDNIGGPDIGIVSGAFPSARYDNGVFYDFTLTMLLNAETSIPAGSTVYLSINNTVDNANTNARHSVDIHRYNGGFYSAAVLNAKTVINVDNIQVWNAPFLDNNADFVDDSGATVVTSSFPDTTVSIRATISDPFGAFDITGATISYTNPVDSSVTADAPMTDLDDASDDFSSNSKIFESTFVLVEGDIDLINGNWDISITGLEGVEGDVSHTKTTSFLVKPFLPTIALTKTINVISDPINDTTNPKAIPGALISYTINAINTGRGKSDDNSIVLQDEIPVNSELFVGDLACTDRGPGSGIGPVCYQDTVAPNQSGLTYNYAGIISAIDDVSFSTDGIDFSYAPVDTGGFDSNIRYIRITPAGFFNKVTIDGSGDPVNQPEFNFSYQIRLN